MAPIISDFSLMLIAAIVSLVFLIVWRVIERSRHVLVWSAAFALAAAMWGCDLVAKIVGSDSPLQTFLLVGIHGLATAAIAIGFRYRSGRMQGAKLLLGAASVPALLSAGMAVAGVRASFVSLPVILFDAAMFTLAGRALTGRRQQERAAEGVAAIALMALAIFNGLTFVARIVPALGVAIDLDALDQTWAALLPAIVAGVGLFTIFLIAADLADRTRRLGAIDMQTGLLNRRGLEEAVGAIITSLRRSRRSMALALIDIDRFKAINDRFGHMAGDRLIETFGRCLRESANRRDLVARIGGEEFAVVMTDVDAATALRAAEMLREKVAAIEMDFAAPIDLTASFGVTEFRYDDPGFDTLFARADRALYESKSAGRNRATLLT